MTLVRDPETVVETVEAPPEVPPDHEPAAPF